MKKLLLAILEFVLIVALCLASLWACELVFHKWDGSDPVDTPGWGK